MWRIGVWICAWILWPAAAEDIAVGRLLVAGEQLGDPNFSESVVLVVQRDDEEGTVGLILNRKSDIPLSKVFSGVKGARRDPLYLGGPVGRTVAQALVRLSGPKVPNTTRVTGDVYLTTDKAQVEKSISAQTDPSRFRVYIGYAGWAPGQLEGEIQLGAWRVARATPALIFDSEPESLWMRMVRESQTVVASGGRPYRPAPANGYFTLLKRASTTPQFTTFHQAARYSARRF